MSIMDLCPASTFWEIASLPGQTFSRWGDGEWACMLGDQGKNCDDCEYLPELRHALLNTLRWNPPTIAGMQPLAWQGMRDRIEPILPRELTWINADVLHAESERAANAGESFLLVDELRRQDRPYGVLAVGPEWHGGLRLLRILKDGDAFVECPASNAWFDRERIVSEVMGAIRGNARRWVVLLSCGMLANVLVGQLALLLKGELYKRVAILDVGSIWEPYLGLCTRGYHCRIVNKVLR